MFCIGALRVLNLLNFVMDSMLHRLMFLGHMYTGTADGKILDIYDGNIRLLTTLGKPPCGTL